MVVSLNKNKVFEIRKLNINVAQHYGLFDEYIQILTDLRKNIKNEELLVLAAQQQLLHAIKQKKKMEGR